MAKMMFSNMSDNELPRTYETNIGCWYELLGLHLKLTLTPWGQERGEYQYGEVGW
ncbi:predicted protein [Sclerotinia sclerotiorum 1980 UF-70]|uniref:Uncharacterized protein n=1 Tax=Sclerotinia sclerotiorum (strain ATCC 18683 / 1980 / Ss-1) TaxID=665079 RepID=A7EH64_SCLS1|nr:predicted protein [Sclerotinia sclerotiorum 1980 UF-70]EDO02180.1 predicted protein [Sclerotinia sclerotiorum 1980 UF-70]